MFQPHDQFFNIYVPKAGSTHPSITAIARGSAMVAAQSDVSDSALVLDNVNLYYEGNVFGACNLKRFTARLHCAAGRSATRYPTVARAFVPASELELVGRYDYRNGVVVEIHEPEALQAFLGEEVLPAEGEGWRY